MAAGELGKAIEERVAGFTTGREALAGRSGEARDVLGGRQEQLRQDFLRQRGQFDPFVDVGTAAAEQLQRGSTVGGLDEALSQILGSGAFQSLRDQRFGDVQRQLAAGGQTRSGAGLEQIANISPELGFGILNQLTGQQQNLANLGLQGAQAGSQLSLGQGQLSSGLSGLDAQLLQQLGIGEAGTFTGTGEAQASGRELGLQQGADRFGQILGLAGSLGGAALGGPIGSSLGGSLGNLFSGGGGGGGQFGGGQGIGFRSNPNQPFFSSGIGTGSLSF